MLLEVSFRSKNSLSAYDPIDLFSNHPDKFKTAISNLLKTPQNNLRIFQNGIPLFNDKKSNPQNLNPILQDLNVSSISDFSTLLYQILWQDNKILKILLDLQKLDTCGSVAAFNIFKNLSDSEISELNDFDSNLWKNLAAKISDFLKNCSSSLADDSSQNSSKFLEILDSNSASKILKLAKYLIAATFKDCSILIALEKLNPIPNSASQENSQNLLAKNSRLSIIHFENQAYLVKITLVDFDPKPLSKLQRYVYLHQAILKIHKIQDDSVILV